MSKTFTLNYLIFAAATSALFVQAMRKNKSSGSISSAGTSSNTKKFPGYQIQNQCIYVTDPDKMKKFLFDTGKNEPEGSLNKLAFGSDYVTYTDSKKDKLYNDQNIVVKTKQQQDLVYAMMLFLFSGAYQQSPHRAGYYADLMNKFSVFVKNMFNTDLPIIKSLDDAKILFEETAKAFK